MKLLKKRVFKILDVPGPEDKISRYFDVFILVLIALNVVAVVLESEKIIATQFKAFFYYFEAFSVLIFSVEYLLRLWTSTLYEQFQKPIIGRLLYAITPLALIDLAAILPFFLPMFFAFDLRFLRILRLVRAFRVIKMARYSNSLKTLGVVLLKKKEELIITFTVSFFLLIIISCLMFHVENKAQPEAFSSIPRAMWWAVATLTTVGYGDIYPVTVFGKILGAIASFLGIGIFALPTGIIGAGFVEEINKVKRYPHCGQSI